jgi:serine protease Do
MIVTSQGVYLDGARTIVVLSDGQVHQATVLRRNRRLQLALLKIDAKTPDHFQIENSPAVTQGDWVVAMSNAFRVADKQEPVSAWLGIVSLPTSIDAYLNSRDIAYSGEMILVDSITSNPGAGGGGLVSLDGELVGVIGKIIESSETNTRLNYAVPIPLVKDFVNGKLDSVAADDKPSEPVDRGETGIRLFEMGGKSGPAYIDQVAADSPAKLAGFQADDLIVSVNGEKTGSVRECLAELEKLQGGVEVVIVVKRGRDLFRLSVTPQSTKAKLGEDRLEDQVKSQGDKR